LFHQFYCISAGHDDADASGVADHSLGLGALDFAEITKQENEGENHRQSNHNGERNIDAFEGQLL
jgi:hypothetical protein